MEHPCSRRFRGFTLLELLVVMAIVALVASLLLPLLAHEREEARQAVCKSHMKNFGLALSMYSNDYGGFYATRGLDLTVGVDDLHGLGSLCLLYDQYITALTIYDCPSTKDDASSPTVGLSIDPVLGLITARPGGCSYGYDSQKRPKTPVATAIAADRANPRNRLLNSPNHGGMGQNVLFYDGHVEWCATPKAAWPQPVPASADSIFSVQGNAVVLASTDSYITQ